MLGCGFDQAIFTNGSPKSEGTRSARREKQLSNPVPELLPSAPPPQQKNLNRRDAEAQRRKQGEEATDGTNHHDEEKNQLATGALPVAF
jgi:hypothetical protein